MNLIDALKSGKRFRRLGWFTPNGDKNWLVEYDKNIGLFNVTDILADDWEIQEPEKARVFLWEYLEDGYWKLYLSFMTEETARKNFSYFPQYHKSRLNPENGWEE